MIKKCFVSILILFFIAGCTKQPIQETRTLSLTIKSPYIRTSGSGFYRVGKSYTNLQLYSAGQMVINYESNTLTCINDRCMPKSTFNENVFKNSHYGDLMNDILRSRPIYNSLNLQDTEFGFTQEIYKDKEYDIKYEIKEDTITFIDTMNNITIKIVKNRG